MRRIVPGDGRVVVGRRAEVLALPQHEAGPHAAVVVSVGDGEPHVAGSIGSDRVARLLMPYAPGDVVIFGKYAGSELSLDGEEFVILRLEEILGKIEKAGDA